VRAALSVVDDIAVIHDMIGVVPWCDMVVLVLVDVDVVAVVVVVSRLRKRFGWLEYWCYCWCRKSAGAVGSGVGTVGNGGSEGGQIRDCR